MVIIISAAAANCSCLIMRSPKIIALVYFLVRIIVVPRLHRHRAPRAVVIAYGPMKKIHIALAILAVLTAASALAHPPKTHRLEATPATVAYGYYWADAPPVLRIDSGDIIDVDTLLTNTPSGLAKAGVPDDKIQASLKAIVSEVTGERRGPGGHILTGPVYVEGAEPGDVLEVKILSIELPLDYGYNGCSGYLPENCETGVPAKIIHLDRQKMTAEFLPGIVIPLKPFY